MADYSFKRDMPRLLKAMEHAPSILNQRPWELRLVADDRVEFYSAPDEELGKLLPREVVISCGAALYNLRLAIRVAGRQPSMWLLPGLDNGSGLLNTVTSRQTLLAAVEVMPSRSAPSKDAQQELYEALWLRRTDRWPHQYVPVPPPVLVEMEIAAAQERGWMRVLSPRQCRQALSSIASANKKIREARELTDHLARLNKVPVADYGPTPAGKQAEEAPPTRPAFWRGDSFAPFEDRLRTPRAARRRTQLIALATDDDRPLDWLRAGEALQHALLNGTRFSMSRAGGRSTPYRQELYYGPLDPHRLRRRPPVPDGYAVEASFLTQSLELADLRALTPADLPTLGRVDLDDQPGKDRWRWPWHSYYTEIPQMLLRVGYAPATRVTEYDDEGSVPARPPEYDDVYTVPIPRPARD